VVEYRYRVSAFLGCGNGCREILGELNAFSPHRRWGQQQIQQATEHGLCDLSLQPWLTPESAGMIANPCHCTPPVHSAVTSIPAGVEIFKPAGLRAVVDHGDGNLHAHSICFTEATPFVFSIQ
jgi:hypothetical protein